MKIQQSLAVNVGNQSADYGNMEMNYFETFYMLSEVELSLVVQDFLVNNNEETTSTRRGVESHC